MTDCVVDIFFIACFRALHLPPSSWGLWHSGCVMNTPEMQGLWFELFFPCHSVSHRNVHCVLNTRICRKCPELYQWGKIFEPQGEPCQERSLLASDHHFPRSTAHSPAHKPVLSALLALEAKPVCIELTAGLGFHWWSGPGCRMSFTSRPLWPLWC